jgi:hypothetical protein
MWISRTFEWVGDHDRGAGWRPEGMPDLDPLRGFGVAHDAMEHFSIDSDIRNEGVAFGVILWGREGGGWSGWNRPGVGRQTFGEIMASDLAEFICQRGSVPFTRAGSKPLATVTTDWDWADDALEEVARIATNDHLIEYAEVWNYDTTRWSEDLRNFLRCARLGFRMAAHRIGKFMWPSEWMEMFDEVSNHPLLSHKFTPESELDKLVIRINYETQEVEVTLDEYRDPYMDADEEDDD